ncbi:hypothetical protein BMS3Abin09_00630 [bacterium BMS3Abin09]|nr:hypothetical protein BMS3Abin09_00630 [bacterium BMS3Abin09]
MGVLAAPASTLTMPIAANIEEFCPVMKAKKVPAVAPMKNMGVTIPPLPQKERVMLVNTIFRRKSYVYISVEDNAWCMVSSPSPRYFVDVIKARIISIQPPMSPLYGSHMSIFLLNFSDAFNDSMSKRAQKPKKRAPMST